MTRILDKVALWIQRHEGAEPVKPGLPPIVRTCAWDGKPIRGIGYIKEGEWYCRMGCASLLLLKRTAGQRVAVKP